MILTTTKKNEDFDFNIWNCEDVQSLTEKAVRVYKNGETPPVDAGFIPNNFTLVISENGSISRYWVLKNGVPVEADKALKRLEKLPVLFLRNATTIKMDHVLKEIEIFVIR